MSLTRRDLTFSHPRDDNIHAYSMTDSNAEFMDGDNHDKFVRTVVHHGNGKAARDAHRRSNWKLVI